MFPALSDASERIGATVALAIASAVKGAVLVWRFTAGIIPFLPRSVGRFCRGSLRWRIRCTKHPPSPRLPPPLKLWRTSWRTSQASAFAKAMADKPSTKHRGIAAKAPSTKHRGEAARPCGDRKLRRRTRRRHSSRFYRLTVTDISWARLSPGASGRNSKVQGSMQ